MRSYRQGGSGVMEHDQNTSGYYKAQAREMLDLAREAMTEESRHSYLELATKWMRLSDSPEASANICAALQPEKNAG